eukprot:4371582-Amphidinium_carterae.2
MGCLWGLESSIQGFFDGHPLVNWRHENLMRLFFRALRSFMKPGGVVKVASNMSAVGVRFSYIMLGARENEFVHEDCAPPPPSVAGVLCLTPKF